MDMCKFRLVMALAVVVHPFAIRAAAPDRLEAAPNSQPRVSLTDLQARFAKLQQSARPQYLAFELRLVDETHALLGQRDDGIVRLPQGWALSAPDGETLDFLMLLGLADAIAREPTPQGSGTATKIVTGTLGYIATTLADNRRAVSWPAPHFESSAPPGHFAPALRALAWTTATGACELLIIDGLRKLGATNSPIGRETRQILKALGAVAWTPEDRCGPPPR